MSRRMRVLIADDHAAHRRLLAQVFGALGCIVTTVSDGEAAVAAPGRFDVICLDRHMPGMGGVQAAEALRGASYLVACTSDPEGLGAPFDAVLAKPIQCGDLAKVLEAAQDRRASGGPGAASPRQARTPSAAASAVAKVA